jgi:hypothetical protein
MSQVKKLRPKVAKIGPIVKSSSPSSEGNKKM